MCLPVWRRLTAVSAGMMETVAFLGTGTMGMPMARHLLRAGFPVRAWNRSPERARPLADDGAEVVEEVRAASDGAGLMMTILSDTDAVLDSVSDALESLGSDALWLQMSTIGITGTERCDELADQAGVVFVDAPVLGTRAPA